MKKYQLIKLYPNSPDLGTILTESNAISFEDYSEFWEEIKEREVEILAFINIGDSIFKNKIVAKETDSCWVFKYDKKNRFIGETTLSYFLNKTDEWKIHSIKRLSDGVIFTIDQKFVLSKEWDGFGTISEFLDEGESVMVINKWKNVKSKTKFIEKARPLFTTYDGIDKYEGDDWYTLEGSDLEGSDLKFSTKEALKFYMFMNKKRFSLNDLENLKRHTPQLGSFDVKRLVDYVKEGKI